MYQCLRGTHYFFSSYYLPVFDSCVCISDVYHCCDQILHKRQLRGRRYYFFSHSLSRGDIYYGIRAWWYEHEAASYTNTSQETEGEQEVRQVYKPQTPNPVTHFF